MTGTAPAEKMTVDKFKAWYARNCENGWADVEPWLDVEPCDCGEYYCQGWQTVYKSQTASPPGDGR